MEECERRGLKLKKGTEGFGFIYENGEGVCVRVNSAERKRGRFE